MTRRPVVSDPVQYLTRVSDLHIAAAIVAAVYADDRVDLVDLHVFEPGKSFPVRAVREGTTPGCWRWPVREGSDG